MNLKLPSRSKEVLVAVSIVPGVVGACQFSVRFFADMLIPGLFFIAMLALLPFANIAFTYFYLSHKKEKSHYLPAVIVNWFYCILLFWTVNYAAQMVKANDSRTEASQSAR